MRRVSRKMSTRVVMVLLAGACLSVSACDKKADAPPAAEEKLRDAPDFGGVKSVYVEADGHGPSAAAAIDDAVQTAVKQVNGAQVSSQKVQISVAASAYANNQSTDFASDTFAQALTNQTGGQVSDFKVLKPASKDFALPGAKGESWTVRIGAHIAKYQAGADAGRPRVIVAMPVSRSGSYELGNGSVSKQQAGDRIRRQISDALAQTNRFTVLDTASSGALDDEADRIASGDVAAADVSRLGQRLAADLIIIPTIDRLGYVRHAQDLRMSDRQLVSYSGGAAISFKVINATTGALVMTRSYQAVFPSTSPTTLGAHVDGLNVGSAAMTDLTAQFVRALMQTSFPLSVIKLDGVNVVLGQGGDMVREGTTYRAVLLGEDMKDPQTGQDLGRTESDFGTVLITRVDPKLSYGVLQNAPALSQTFRPGLIELRDPEAVDNAAHGVSPQASSGASSGKPSGGIATKHKAHGKASGASDTAADTGSAPDKNW